MLRQILQLIVSFVALAAISFSALIVQTARNDFVQRQPINEIEITYEKRPVPGSFKWDLEHQCGHIRNLFPLQNYIDCLVIVEDLHMHRKDI